ncbi:neutral zinc metallopeptidase [Sphaerisporangium fuscum]|uniref:neutral zinc metallopeptidase n=1 Tax=Sphaerisporangium fuscum TaxID=2835868 RepID=UPI002029AE1F|nr:neutral zinc metallopeptidase [Sphaerisporangium fuscum]
MTHRAVAPVILMAVLVSLVATGCSSVEYWKDQLTLPSRPAAAVQPQAAPQQTGAAPRSTTAFGTKFEEDVQLARTLTEEFWQDRFQAAGKTYRPLERFVAYSGRNGPSCGGRPALPQNAFYCPIGNFVAYDQTWMRSLWKQLGDGAVYVIIPHEIGHSIQAQLRSDFSFNVERELQADCYAGGALKGIIDAGRLQADPGDDEELLDNLAAAGDPDDNWMREDAHGTPAQRQQSFTKGFTQGVDAC